MNTFILNDNAKQETTPMKLFKIDLSDKYWNKDVDLWTNKQLLNNIFY